jgi:hypothetical protein
MEKFNSYTERQMGHENYTKICHKYLHQVYESQTKKGAEPILIFTALRDPLDRFLSSLGQVLKGPRGILRRILTPCHNRMMTTALLIDCVLHKMETSPFFSYLDEHFVPQSFELYSGLLGLDIAVDVIDLSATLSEVVAQLGGTKDGDNKHRNSAVGIVDEYPQFVLTPSALTEDFQARICRLYEVDVLMIEQTRITTTKCRELLRR